MKIALAVEDMKRHMTNEGWQIFEALECNGYELYGHNLPNSETDVNRIISSVSNIDTLVIQDRREWLPKPGDFRANEYEFKNYRTLKEHPEIFKVSICKDAHHKFHQEFQEEMGIDAWIHYYDREEVLKVAPYIRGKHLIRTYHTIDATKIPPLNRNKLDRALLSGAVSRYHYPLRWKMYNWHAGDHLKKVTLLKHPGYHNKGSHTEIFYQILNDFKVMICTASRYQYALRKIFEGTACGCVVITDLKEKLPEIDRNLVRIPSDIEFGELNQIIQHTLDEYDYDRQEHLAKLCMAHYDFGYQGKLLAEKIASERRKWLTSKLS